MIMGLSHIGLEVRAPAQTAQLFQLLFSARIITRNSTDGPPETFVFFADVWFSLIEGDGIKFRSDDHIALAVSEGDLEIYAERLEKIGLQHRYSKKEIPPKSLYFYDYDNHFFELQTGFLENEISPKN